MPRRKAAVIGIMAALLACPIISAQEEPKPVILLYHGPKVGNQDLRTYGEALASLINTDPRMKDKADIKLVGDPDLMKTLLHFPQVKCAIIALTTWESKDMTIIPSALWYFNQGGGLVGLGNVAYDPTEASATGTPFPVYGNDHERGKIVISQEPATGKRIIETMITYSGDQDHEIARGVEEEFDLKDMRFVIHLNLSATQPHYVPRQPEKGEYTVVYRDSEIGAPLVVVYEENGTSVTFTGTDQMSIHEDEETYFGRFLDNENFAKLFQNAVYYAWNQEDKYENAMAKAEEGFERVKEEEEDLKRRIESSEKRGARAKILRFILLAVIGVVVILVLSYYCFVMPARQRPAPEARADRRELLGVVGIAIVLSTLTTLLIIGEGAKEDVTILSNEFPAELPPTSLSTTEENYQFALKMMARKPLVDVTVRYNTLTRIEDQDITYIDPERETGSTPLETIENVRGLGTLLEMAAPLDLEPFIWNGTVEWEEANKVHDLDMYLYDFTDLVGALTPNLTALGVRTSYVFCLNRSTGCLVYYFEGISDYFYDRNGTIIDLTISHNDRDMRYHAVSDIEMEGRYQEVMKAPLLGRVRFEDVKKDDYLVVVFSLKGTSVPRHKGMLHAIRVYANGRLHTLETNYMAP